MPEPGTLLKKRLIRNALDWFQPHLRQTLVSPIESQFPNWPLTREIQMVLHCTEAISRAVDERQGDEIPLGDLLAKLSDAGTGLLPLFKRIILLYRRDRAAHTERYTEKTFHLELSATLEQEVNALDALTSEEGFQRIEHLRLPRLKDFLPVQHIESAEYGAASLLPRQYDEKFHILQAPQLFLPDVGYFRAKCEDRESPLAIAFMDIDDFKRNFNTPHGETKVDRNVLPRFMQTVEAHLFHHGYAYRQGGDEYLILLPSLSRPLAVAFLDELRRKLANLAYPDVKEKTTVSIGLCVVDSDCLLTDRELLGRANRAKQFAKEKGKNCIATYNGPRFIEEELELVSAPTS
jgi:diguanylate cyclase (GGDEF)-like protein